MTPRRRRLSHLLLLSQLILAPIGCSKKSAETLGTIQFDLVLPSGMPESIKRQISLIEIFLDEVGTEGLFSAPRNLEIKTNSDGIQYETQVADVDGDGRYEFYYGMRQNSFGAGNTWSIPFQGDANLPTFKAIGRIYTFNGLALVATAVSENDSTGQPIRFGSTARMVTLSFTCEPLINCAATSDGGVDAGAVADGGAADAGAVVDEFGVMRLQMALPGEMSAGVRGSLGLVDFYLDETGATALFQSEGVAVTGLTPDGVTYDRQVTDVDQDGRREYYVRLLKNPFDGGTTWGIDLAGSSTLGTFNVRGRLWNSTKTTLVATAFATTDALANAIQFRADGGSVNLTFACESAALCSDPDASAYDAGPGFAVLSVAPAKGPTSGGTSVTIVAQAVVDPVAVKFGSQAAASLSRDGGTVFASTPAAQKGFVDVTVSIPDASVVLTNGFEFYDPVSVITVSPSFGYFDGGTEVTIAGFGFVAGSIATMGGAAATVLSIDPSGASITVRTPPGPPLDPMSVTVTNANGTSTKDAAYTYYQLISTLAGGGPTSGVPATSVYLMWPVNAAFDPQGRIVFASYLEDQRIYRIELDGTLTRLAGTGEDFSGPDGPATETAIRAPYAIAFNDAGELHFSEYSGNVVRKIVDGGLVTVAGNRTAAASGDNAQATSAAVGGPYGIAFDTKGRLLITQYGYHRVRRVDTNGIISTVAGTGVSGFAPDAGLIATEVQMYYPSSVVEWPAGSNEFVVAELGCNCDAGPGVLRYVDADGGTRLLVGGGASLPVDGVNALQANTTLLSTVARLPGGDLLLSQTGVVPRSSRVFRYNASAGTLSVLAGTTGTPATSNDGVLAASSPVYQPYAFASPAGAVYFSEYGSGRIRTITDAGLLATVAGNITSNFFGDLGPATEAGFYLPFGVARDSLSGAVYVADYGNNRIRKVVDGGITTVAGNGTTTSATGYTPALDAGLGRPYNLAVDPLGGLFVTSAYSHRVYKMYTNGYLDVIAGNGIYGYTMDAGGPAIGVALGSPFGVAVHAASGDVYFAEAANQVIRRVTTGGQIYSVAGIPGVTWLDGGSIGDGLLATAATLDSPIGLAFDSKGNLLVADRFHHRIRRILLDAGGLIETVAGEGDAGGINADGIPALSAVLGDPFGICVDAFDRLFIAQQTPHVIYRVARNDAGVDIIRRLAGTAGLYRYKGENVFAKDSVLYSPHQIACLPGDNVIFVDSSDNRVRRIH